MSAATGSARYCRDAIDHEMKPRRRLLCFGYQPQGQRLSFWSTSQLFMTPVRWYRHQPEARSHRACRALHTAVVSLTDTRGRNRY